MGQHARARVCKGAWAHKCSPEQLEEHINAQAQATGRAKKPVECEAEAATMYAEQTAAHLASKGGGAGAEDPFGLGGGAAGATVCALESD